MTRTLHIHLTPRNGRPQSFTLEGGTILIGTGAHCEVRLAHGSGAMEHVVLRDVGGAGLQVEALSANPAPTLDGRSFSKSAYEPGATLEIGGTTIVVNEVTAAASQATRTKEKSNPLVYIAAAIIAPYALLDLGPKEDAAWAPPREAPPLFTDAPEPCPQAEVESAGAYAAEQLRLAAAKAERRPFHAQDGVRAVALYRVGAACARVAGDDEAAAEADRAAGAMKQDIDESYRTRRVRLEHALSIKDDMVARREIAALLDLTRGQSGEYVSWLSNLDRRLRLRQGQAQGRSQ